MEEELDAILTKTFWPKPCLALTLYPYPYQYPYIQKMQFIALEVETCGSL